MKKTLLKILIAVGLIIIIPWSIYRINEIYYMSFVNEYLPLSKRDIIPKLCNDRRVEKLIMNLRYEGESEKKYLDTQINQCKKDNRATAIKDGRNEILVSLYPKIPFFTYYIIIVFYYEEQKLEKHEIEAKLEFI